MRKAAFVLLVLLAVACAASKAHPSRVLFDRLDRAHDGSLDFQDIRNFACGKFNTFCQLNSVEQTRSAINQINTSIHSFDLDGSGTIEYEEFAFQMYHLTEPIESGPQQVHLALTTKPSEMVVMWVTREKVSSIVRYGTSSGHYTMQTTGTITTYDAGVFGWSGWIHTVTLTGLTPANKYYYIAGSHDDGYWSDEFSFTTAPVQGKFSDEYTFAVVADMGTAIPMGWAVTDQIVADNSQVHFNMIIHAGDVCYAGTGSTWELEEIWDVWGDQMQPLAANVPYMFAVGNHEHYYNFTSFTTRYTMPGPQSGGNGNFWYSITYGYVHFVFMSTEHDYDPGSPQYQWLQQDMAAARQNSNVKWLIMSGHRPMYNSDTGEWTDHRPGAHFQVMIEPLMHKYQVDLYLCGHMHMYERIFPVLNGTVVATGNNYVNPTATAHVVQATAGVFTDSSFINPQPVWSARRDNKFGYGRMTITSNKLLYQYLHQDDGSLLDEFTITKQ